MNYVQYVAYIKASDKCSACLYSTNDAIGLLISTAMKNLPIPFFLLLVDEGLLETY